MPPQVDFYFDVGSPAAYLAFTQIEAIAREAGASVNHKPMLLGGVFQATGNASPATVPAKGAYTFTDFDRFARRYGVPLKRNPHFPINTLALMRAVTGMQMREPARFLDFTRTVFESIWLHALNMNDPAVVAQQSIRAFEEIFDHADEKRWVSDDGRGSPREADHAEVAHDDRPPAAAARECRQGRVDFHAKRRHVRGYGAQERAASAGWLQQLVCAG